jgi:hypothetical protein
MYKKIEIKGIEDLPKETGYYLYGKKYDSIANGERVHLHGKRTEYEYIVGGWILLPISEDEYLREERIQLADFIFKSALQVSYSKEHIESFIEEYLKTRKV